MFVVLWEFEVKPEFERHFERVYGSDGTWAQLFRTDRNFQKTVLVQDLSRPHMYLTLDF